MSLGSPITTDDEHSNQVQNDDVGTEQNKITRGD